MKKLLMGLSGSILSRSQMKSIRGGYGGDVGCWCVYALTTNSSVGRCSTKLAPEGTSDQDCNGICATDIDPAYCLEDARLRNGQTCPFS